MNVMLHSRIGFVLLISLFIFAGSTPSRAFTESELKEFFYGSGEGLDLDRPLTSWLRLDLKYASLGLQSREMNPVIKDYMDRLSTLTGLKIYRDFSGPYSIIILSENTVLYDLHDRPQRFRQLGLTDTEIHSLQENNPRPRKDGPDACAVQNFVNESGDISFSVIMLQDKSEYCIATATLVSVSVYLPSLDREKQAFHMACVLYQGRRLGARTPRELLSKGDEIEKICSTLEQNK
jgi:hypothetical protein